VLANLHCNVNGKQVLVFIKWLSSQTEGYLCGVQFCQAIAHNRKILILICLIKALENVSVVGLFWVDILVAQRGND
jgi:hypothetical protein